MHKKLSNSRRDFIKTTGKAGLAAGLSLTVLPSIAAGNTVINGNAPWAEDIPYEQQPLGYAYTALEPVMTP